MKLLHFVGVHFNLKPQIGVLKRLRYWLMNKYVGSIWVSVNKDKKLPIGDIYYRHLKGSFPCEVFIRPTDAFDLSFYQELDCTIEAMVTPFGASYEGESVE